MYRSHLPLRLFFPLAGVAFLAAITLQPAAAQFGQSGPNPFKPPAATIHYARNRDYHVQHLKLIFDIDAAAHSAHGIVTHTLVPLRDGLDHITMDAGANLDIESCRVDGQEMRYTHNQNVLTVQLPEPLPRGKETVLEIRYTMPGGKTGGGANGVGGFMWIDPRPSDPGRRPGFWTQGETNTNSNWVPCYDYPNDKCTSETITTVPETWTVIGNGTEGPMTSDKVHHTRTYRWTMTQPHSTYLLSLAGGELDVKKGEWAGIPLYYAVPKGKGDLIDASFGNTPDMLQFFSDKLGVKYPWPKYAQSAVYDFPGGMENVSATTLGVYGLTDARRGKYTMSSLNSHELAHQWFGDLVTCKDWGDIWLNESFATFFEMLYMEHLEGKEQYDQEKDSNLRSYLRGDRRNRHALSTKLYADPDAMFESSHTYAKGGVILAMLRHQLGDTNFFRGLGHYLKVNAYQPVDTHDLEKAITEETGINVEPFFDQWVFKPGHPVLDMTWSYDAAGKAVVVHVKQLQDTSDGTPIYDIPLTLGLLTASSSPSGGGVRRQQVQLNKADQEFRLSADVKPDVVLLDPDHDLLKEIKDNHWIEADLPVILRLAPCHLDRLRAAQQIASEGSMDAAKTRLFADVLRNEPAESVGVYLIGKLDALKDPSLRSLFRGQARSEQPERRAAALTALGDLPGTDADIALLRSEAASDTEPYIVVESALRALSHLNDTGSLPVFRHQIMAKSLRDRLARTAIEALTESKADAAAPLLIEASEPSHSTEVRVAAIDSLSKVALGNPEVHTQLLALLKDSNSEIEKSVVHTLRERNDKAAAAALRALATSAPDKEVQQAASDAADNLSGR